MTALLFVLAGRIPAAEPPADGDAAARAIREVLAQDSALGEARNHAPETGTLAAAVRDYVDGIDGIDFSACPEDFSGAFRRHRDAWEASIGFLRRFDELRGEMHALFDAIRDGGGQDRARLERLEKTIWDTWAEVEAAAEKHDRSAAEGDPGQPDLS